MKMEWLMIPGFILCALIMKFFVKMVDSFITHIIMTEETAQLKENCSEEIMETSPAEQINDMKLKRLTISQMIDKLRLARRTMQDAEVSNIEIGTARPTQIRIRRYENS